MAVLGDHRVAELLVEAEVAGELAAHAHADLPVSVGVGVVMDPHHQRLPDALALPRRIDGDPPYMDGAGLVIEPQAADRQLIEQSKCPA